MVGMALMVLVALALIPVCASINATHDKRKQKEVSKMYLEKTAQHYYPKQFNVNATDENETRGKVTELHTGALLANWWRIGANHFLVKFTDETQTRGTADKVIPEMDHWYWSNAGSFDLFNLDGSTLLLNTDATTAQTYADDAVVWRRG